MATNTFDAMTVRLLDHESLALRTYLEKTFGFTLPEFLQLVCHSTFANLSPKVEANGSYKGEFNEMLERRMLASPKESLSSYRQVLGVQEHTPRAGQILYAILVHPGNVISTFNPYDPDYIAGSVSLGKEVALRLILSENGHLPPKLVDVMKYRDTESVLRVLEEIVNDEYNLMLMQSSLPKVSQNEYGMHYNKKMNRDGIPR